jgi:hypothetical protein
MLRRRGKLWLPAKMAGFRSSTNQGDTEDMTQNFVSRHLDDSQWVAVDQAIDALNTALEPLLVAMAADQRRRAVKMGDGSEAFCRQALNVITENIALMPRNFDLDEMRRDLGSHDALHARAVRLTRLMEKVHDTDTALGSDAMVAALEGYTFLKAAGKGEGIDTLRKMLGRRFDNNGHKPEAAPVAATA